MTIHTCAECGATSPEGKTCRDYLNNLITWDFEDFTGVGQIHHLTVVCFNLQHPSVYSAKGLEDAKCFLREYMGTNFSFAEHDARNRELLASDVRDWKISGTPDDHGSYKMMPTWTMTAKDIVEGGLDNYVENVKKWSHSIYEAIKSW